MLFMAILFAAFSAVHRHYESVGRQLRRGSVRAGDYGVNHMVVVIRDLDAAAAEAVGVVRSIRPTELHILHPTDEPIPPELQERWRAFSRNASPLEPLRLGKDNLLDAVKRYVRGIERAPEDFVNVVIPEVVQGSLLGYVLRRASLIRLKAGLLREPNIVVTDVPVVLEEGQARGRGRSSVDPGADGGIGLRLGRARCDDPGRQLRRNVGGVRDASDLLRPGSGGRRSDAGGMVRSRSTDPTRHRRGAVPRPHPADARGGPALLESPGHRSCWWSSRSSSSRDGGTASCTIRTRCSSSGCSCSNPTWCCPACRS